MGINASVRRCFMRSELSGGYAAQLDCGRERGEIELSGLTPKLTGAGARSAQGTNIDRKNTEDMAHVGVRVEPQLDI